MNDIDVRRIADALESIASSLEKMANPAYLVSSALDFESAPKQIDNTPNTFPCTRRGIIEAVEQLTGLDDLRGQGRSHLAEVVRARHVAMNLMRELLEMSFSEIGRFMYVDHTTAIYAAEKHRDYWAITPVMVTDAGARMAYRSLYEQAKKLVAPRPVVV